MDISKLPKLSTTDAPPPPAESDAPASREVIPYGVDVPSRSSADAWLSIAVGVILLFMSPRLLQYVFTRANFTWTFSDAQGNPLAYTNTVYFWGDLALIAFALVLIVQGIVTAWMRSRPFIAGAFALTVLATGLNACYLIYMMNGYGFQLMAAMAVAFGVYIAMQQWRILKVMPTGTR